MNDCNDILNLDEKPLSTFMLSNYGWDLKGKRSEVAKCSS